jgi:predicted ATPase
MRRPRPTERNSEPHFTDARPPLIREITPRNILSFGPEPVPLELRALNVLIGPNGSGKSNLLEVLGLARATPGDVRSVLRRGGGVREWIWKGDPHSAASFDLVIENPGGPPPLRHVFEFAAEQQAFRLTDERIETQHPYPGYHRPFLFYDFRGGQPVVSKREAGSRSLQREEFDLNASILSQIKDPETYPEITRLARAYGTIRLYREWAFGRNTVFREPQQADARNDRLEEDFSNLGMFLNRLTLDPPARRKLRDELRQLYEGLDDFVISVEGGTVQVFCTEGEFTVPATRLSDGTLRYLCLLSILCDPEPPPLVCLEEPELGLHPDVLPHVADLLLDASQRTQLIVTTHSESIVDALTPHPETVVVCEKVDGVTRMCRLDAGALSEWLERYRLGELWTRGDLGGTRW